ncbi:RNA polymerase sigma factor [Pseudonocardia hydrocarbonoxydans]|uniref:DNA-directed RNA polymerase sigma-70 factor n=1 Tax=Pseudonocardia hydrocarbonoxydans TaxID=76726 RepID=A0A4Y3WMC3_9PSEU|nr:sigma-70 family RNA polymerase sigma factor [Pseudonocardia hydrocarbonoxydans]GEC19401.1 DNA-directed RNA polymerase sigma-70 factor [Pseudonocardia hydrocarbonoxydans]
MQVARAVAVAASPSASGAEVGSGVSAVPDELDEQTLVVRAQEGDARAFEQLARRHQDALYRLAVRVMGDRAEAEDALQEALLDAWRRIGRFRGESAFSTWMYRIVTNRCLGMLRKRRPVPVEEVDAAPAPAQDSPERAAERDAGMAALHRALAALPDDLRVCWVLREVEGQGYAEIAQITGATEDAVRGRIHRARTRLAEAMRSWR